MRKRFALAAALSLMIVVPFTVIGIMGSRAWLWSAGVVTGAFIATLACLMDTPPSHIANWQLGEWGEKTTAKTLKPLRREGWHVLHDLQRERGNIDHVVVGPGGIFLLDSKWLMGSVEVDGDTMTVRRFEEPDDDYDDTIGPRARAAAWELHDRLRQASRVSNWVQSVVVIHGGFEASLQTTNRVAYVAGRSLVAFLRDQPKRVDEDRVEQLVRLVSGIYEPASPPEPAARESTAI
jgi:hypothetical protein